MIIVGQKLSQNIVSQACQHNSSTEPRDSALWGWKWSLLDLIPAITFDACKGAWVWGYLQSGLLNINNKRTYLLLLVSHTSSYNIYHYLDNLSHCYMLVRCLHHKDSVQLLHLMKKIRIIDNDKLWKISNDELNSLWFLWWCQITCLTDGSGV